MRRATNSEGKRAVWRDGDSAVLRCECKEKVISLDGNDVIFKARLLKVAGATTLAKCKRCGRWVEVPFYLTDS